MILRPPKNFNEYSVSVPMSIDWILKTLHRLIDSVPIGYTGTFTVPTNPPGQQNLRITNGIIASVD